MKVFEKNEALDVIKQQLDVSGVYKESLTWSFNGRPLENWIITWLDYDHDEHTTELYVYKD